MEKIPTEAGEEFKVHYHFRDASHEIDAHVRNRCEAEILGLMREVSKLLDVPFGVDIVPPANGGWEEHVLLIGQYREQITFIRDIVVSVFTIGGTALGAGLFLQHRRKHAQQQTTLNDLAIERAKLEVRKMQRDEGVAEKGKSGDLLQEPRLLPNEIASALLSKKKVQLKRSNLYRTLASYSKVEAVGYSAHHRAGAPEKIIQRENFERFIVGPEDLEPVLYKRVQIEVVSPVLRAGNHNWRGIFEKKSISFELDDGEFRRKVLDQEVAFQNGSKLICDLEVQLREDAVGEQEVTKRVVRKVHSVRQVRKANPGAQGKLDLPEPEVPNTPS